MEPIHPGALGHAQCVLVLLKLKALETSWASQRGKLEEGVYLWPWLQKPLAPRVTISSSPWPLWAQLSLIHVGTSSLWGWTGWARSSEEKRKNRSTKGALWGRRGQESGELPCVACRGPDKTFRSQAATCQPREEWHSGLQRKDSL